MMFHQLVILLWVQYLFCLLIFIQIALWFQYPFRSSDKLMFIAGNREIVSKKEDGNGYALYVDTKTK